MVSQIWNAEGDYYDLSDDEDGITFPAFTPGAVAVIDATVVNTTGVNATLYGFIDFDGDGLFTAAGEVVSAAANSSGTYQLNFNVPANADTTQLLGARFRLSTDSGLSPDGAALDGEVEDYLIAIASQDYGDLPDIYGTIQQWHSHRTGGPYHRLYLSLGVAIDDDIDGTPSVGANGDDTMDGIGDEDGIVF